MWEKQGRGLFEIVMPARPRVRGGNGKREGEGAGEEEGVARREMLWRHGGRRAGGSEGVPAGAGSGAGRRGGSHRSRGAKVCGVKFFTERRGWVCRGERLGEQTLREGGESL